MSIKSIAQTGIALGLALSASTVGSQAAEPVQITVIHQGSAPPQQVLIEAFEKVHPEISVELLPIAKSYEEILQTTARDVIVGNPPDVVAVGYNLVRYAGENELVSDIPTAPGADWPALGYPESSLSLCTYNGRLIGLPFATSAPVLFYNGDLVRSAGGDPDKFPTDWPSIFALADKIHELHPDKAGLHFRYDHGGNFSFQGLVFSQGGKMMTDGDKEIAFNGPAGMNGLAVLQHAVETGMVDMSSDQGRQAFAAGTIGIMSESSAALTAMAKTAAGHFDLRVAPYPLSAGGKLPAGGACVSVSSKDPTKLAASMEYIRFITGPVGQTIQTQNQGYIPVNTIALKDPTLLGNFYDTRRNERIIADLLPYLTGWYAFPGENSVRITDVIKDHLQTIVTAHKEPKAVMDAMTADVAALLPKNQ